MRTRLGFSVAVALSASALAAASGFSPEAYRDPPPESSPSFFWMWNCRLDPAQLNAQLDAMASNGLMNVCIHPVPKAFRPNLFTTEMEPDYLTDAYLDVLSNVVTHAASLGMHAWLYDEGGWPSGGAAGLVAASDREGRFRHRSIGFGRKGNQPFGVTVQDYTPGGRGSYPSMIEKGATERFLEITHERIRQRLGHLFGSTVKFAFTDEPDFYVWYWWPMMTWTADFAEEFQRRKGYDILPYMPDIVKTRRETHGPLVEKRLDYLEVLADLFEERYMLPIRDWCRRNGLKSGGHLSGEDDPENGAMRGYGNLLKTLRAMDVPGVDVIWRQLWPKTYATAGRQVPFPRYAAAAANQIGARHVLCEAFGIYGDSLTPLEMQWLCNYHLVRGVNLFVFGYQAVSTAGQWMTLFEPHFGPISPLWEFSRPFYVGLHRTCAILAQGTRAPETVVFYDQRAFWTGGDVATAAASQHYAAATALDAMNCDYDFADESILSAATVSGARLQVGKASYSTVVVPAWGAMTPKTRARIEAFKAAGGKVLMLHEIAAVPRTCGVRGLFAENIRALKRVADGASLYFLANEAMSPTEDVEISLPERGEIVHVNPESGRFERIDSKDGRFTWRFAPAGADIFLVGVPAETAGTPPAPRAGSPRQLKEGWTMRPLRRHFVGKDDFEIETCSRAAKPVALGDWREELGYDFSGVALYRNVFKAKEEGEAELDLGNVCHACAVWLNGERLPDRFAKPFRWKVRLRKGENVLEVRVANTLANAVHDPKVRDRVARAFPPRSVYDVRQAVYDGENQSSGLFGPVILR